jgi:hypothetical protein
MSEDIPQGGPVRRGWINTDYRITRVQVGSATDPSAILDRSLAWTGDVVNRIIDNKNPGTTPGQYGSQSQNFAYTPTRRLSSASRYYGSLAWAYDANGNRLTETANGVVSTYAYPSTSNRLEAAAQRHEEELLKVLQHGDDRVFRNPRDDGRANERGKNLPVLEREAEKRVDDCERGALHHAAVLPFLPGRPRPVENREQLAAAPHERVSAPASSPRRKPCRAQRGA